MKIKKKFRPLSLAISILVLAFIPLMITNIYMLANSEIENAISFSDILIAAMIAICVVLIWYVYRTSLATIEVTDKNVTLVTYTFFKKNVLIYDLIDVLKITEDHGNNKILDSQKTGEIIFKIRKKGDEVYKQNNYMQFKAGEVNELNQYLRNIKKKK